MSKFSIGVTYTVWTDVEANSEAEAVDKAVNTDYDVPDHFELNEYEDPKVYEHDTHGIKYPKTLWRANNG